MTSYTTKGNYPYPQPTDAVTDYPATSATFAGYVDNLPNRNAIINPVFSIWQRGTTFSNPTSGAYTADRWRIAYDGTGGTRNVIASVADISTLTGGMQMTRYLQVQQNTAGSGQTSLTLSQRIEGARTFERETITISGYIWATSNRTITVKLVQNFGTGGSPSAAVTTTVATVNLTTTRNRMRLTTDVPSTVGKILGTNGDDYLELVFEMGNTTGNYVNFWGIQLEQNNTATALERRPTQQEVALCQRYFWRPVFAGIAYMSFIYGTSGQHRLVMPFPVDMRTAPVVTSSGWASSTPTANTPSTFCCQWYNAGGTAFYTDTTTVISHDAEL